MFMPNGFVSVSNGRSNGRSCHEKLMEGRITISGSDGEKGFKRILQIKDGQIIDNRLVVKDRQVFRIAYGLFIHEGKNIIRFKKGTGTGKHGKSRTEDKLFGKKGICHGWYNNGRLVRQRFVYENGKVAYDYRSGSKVCHVKSPDGSVLYELKGILNTRRTWDGLCIFNRGKNESWLFKGHPFEIWKDGKLFIAGQYDGEQKTGKWIENGKEAFYEKGYPMSKKLYETPPEKMDVRKVLRLSNAQLRMALMSRISVDRIAEAGNIIHQHGSMRLYDIEGFESRLLRVKCPSTGNFFFLKVPKDSTKCEEARQWTFHVGMDFDSPIKFAVET